MRRLILALTLVLGACSGAKPCQPGEKGCACAAMQMCAMGSFCSDGKCRDVQRTDLVISDAQSRGCEVLLRETDGKIDRVEFEEDVTGKWLRQGDKVAAAFIANEDASIANGAVKVASAGRFEIMKSHCYGPRGEELPNASVSR